jgi:hypothetical protein
MGRGQDRSTVLRSLSSRRRRGECGATAHDSSGPAYSTFACGSGDEWWMLPAAGGIHRRRTVRGTEMKLALSRPGSHLAKVAIGVGLVATLASALTFAVASTPGKAFSACASKKGVLALASSTGRCKPRFTKVTIDSRGPKGATGPAGPDKAGYDDYVAAPSFPANTEDTLASLKLPSGSYLITAKVALVSEGTAALVRCFLDVGEAEDATTIGVDSGAYDAVPLEIGVKLSAATDAELNCSSGGIAVTADNAAIIAAPVSHLAASTTQ